MSNIPSKHIEAFIAGGFTLIFFKAFVGTLCFFTASVIDGKPEWLKLIGGIVCSAIGVALGVGILVGNSRARRWTCGYLLIMVISESCLIFVSMLHIWPSMTPLAGLKSATDLIINIAILVLFTWNKPEVSHEAVTAEVIGKK